MAKLDLSALDDVLNSDNETPSGEQVLDLDIAKIKADPNQPRKFFDEEELKVLAKNIEEQGQKHPIIVSVPDVSGNYLIRDGERRFRAIILNKGKTIKAIYGEVDDYGQFALNETGKPHTLEEKTLFVEKKLKEGDDQKTISQRSGMSKQDVSKIVAWSERPKCLDDAHKQGLFSSIPIAYDLTRLYKAFPDQTENWIASMIENNEPITATTLKQTRSLFENPISNNEVNSEGTGTTLIQTHGQDNNAQENAGEGGNSGEPVTGEHFANKAPKAPKEKDETKLSKSLILCTVDDRECTLEYKQKPSTNGFVWVKYEDGETVEVVAENVKINSIVEA